MLKKVFVCSLTWVAQKNISGLIIADFKLFQVSDETWTFQVAGMERGKQFLFLNNKGDIFVF